MASQRLMSIAGHLHGVVSVFKSAFGGGNRDTDDNQDMAAVTAASKIGACASADWTTAPLPTFDALPPFKDFTGCAWSVWGEEDQLGTINLLTDEVVRVAAREEIRLGRSVSLNWPLNFPEKPVFERKAPEVNQIIRLEVGIRDDEINMNTQSGTQWDGMRHFPLLEHGVYYNNTPLNSLPSGIHSYPNPHEIEAADRKIGIQNWAAHGICGRGVLLDLVSYHTSLSADKKTLPYDPWSTHAVTVEHLEACAAKQGVKFRRGDILILRVGFIKKYYDATQDEREELATKHETFAGIHQSEEMKRFLWNNHFSAIASDQPTLECWPPAEGPMKSLHQTLLALWGMPIGEFFDLEKLSEVCAETGRYTFFFSSWPLNIIGGCASPANAAAMF